MQSYIRIVVLISLTRQRSQRCASDVRRLYVVGSRTPTDASEQEGSCWKSLSLYLKYIGICVLSHSATFRLLSGSA